MYLAVKYHRLGIKSLKNRVKNMFGKIREEEVPNVYIQE